MRLCYFYLPSGEHGLYELTYHGRDGNAWLTNLALYKVREKGHRLRHLVDSNHSLSWIDD